MGALLAVLVIIKSVLTSVFSRQMADEYKAWTPWLTRRLIDRSVSKLPAELQERFREEWSSHVEEIPGQVAKLFVAAGFIRAASTVCMDHEFPSYSPAPVAGSFGLLPDPENRWGAFGVSLLTNVLILAQLVVVTTVTQTLTAPQAKYHEGENANVCGIVADEYGSMTVDPTFINLDSAFPNQIFTIAVWGKDRQKLDAVARAGSHVCAKGKIGYFRGVPQIRLTNDGQLWSVVTRNAAQQ